ncbi:MAG TPA: hypothetical protein VKX46_05065 [Ktedonobacteraceae bacterium]|nr:hypothetical protein [Ktedonobacteraceae bacterium]
MELAESLATYHMRSTCEQLDCQELDNGEVFLLTKLEDGSIVEYTMCAQDVQTVKRLQAEREG